MRYATSRDQLYHKQSLKQRAVGKWNKRSDSPPFLPVHAPCSVPRLEIFPSVQPGLKISSTSPTGFDRESRLLRRGLETTMCGYRPLQRSFSDNGRRLDRYPQCCGSLPPRGIQTMNPAQLTIAIRYGWDIHRGGS
jgi:hypothetical protein